MSENKSFTGPQIALAFLGAAAAGSAVAMLMAPRSGCETRKALHSFFFGAKQRSAHVPASDTRKAREAFENAIADVESQLIH